MSGLVAELKPLFSVGIQVDRIPVMFVHIIYSPSPQQLHVPRASHDHNWENGSKLKLSDARGSNDLEDDSRRSKQGSVVDLQDLVTKLKRMGNEEFGRFIESQRQQLVSHLSQAKGMQVKRRIVFIDML